jgi:RNA polymerase sigma factor (sigma-70 family)
MELKNELNIINQVLNGNTAAFRVLVDNYKHLVFSMVVKIVKNNEVAEEVTQDSFLKAYHGLSTFKNESKFSTWLFRIAYNTAVSKTRKKTVVTSAIDDYVIENFSIHAIQENIDEMEEDEKLKLLNKAIADLNSDEQLLINLFYFNQQSVEEICTVTGLTDSNVKVRLHRIRKKMYANMHNEMNKVHVRKGL